MKWWIFFATFFAMPPVAKNRRGAVEKLRVANKNAAIAAEEARLDAKLSSFEARREKIEDTLEDLEYLELQKLNVFNISSFYINYDGEFQTRRMNAMLFHELAEMAGYLTPEERARLYGPSGYINTGFPVEGPAPKCGAWPTAKPLSAAEKQQLHVARASLQARLVEIDAKGKLKEAPNEFETPSTMERCYAAIRKLMNGPVATEVPKEDVPMGTWVFPFFGLGQRWSDELMDYTKVRPIANERKRNDLRSPIAEHLVLPGTDVIVDLSFACLNPTYLDSVMQTKHDVIKSLEEGRRAAKKKKGERLQWRDTSTMPRGKAVFNGHSFVPTYGKLDLFQAYFQLAVAQPERNLFQVWSPCDEEFRYGMLNALSFGNVHSVFGFCAGVSELINSVVSDLLDIPSATYIDDLIYVAAPGLTDIYMNAIRRLLACMGIAVAPEKCLQAEYGQTIEILGINFTPYEWGVVVQLPEKKVKLIGEKADAIVVKLSRILKDAASVSRDELTELFHQLETLSGLFIHAIFWKSHKRGLPLTRHIYELTKSQRQFYQKVVSGKNASTAKLFISRMKEEIERREPMILSKEAATRPRVHVCTDAAMSGAEVSLGGMVFDAQQRAKGFSIYLKQNELPLPLRRKGILEYELLATRLAQILFKDEVSANHSIFLGDNAAATFGIVRGQIRNPTGTALICSICKASADAKTSSFFGYINTHRNPADALTRIELLKDLTTSYDVHFPFGREEIVAAIYKVADEVLRRAGWKSQNQITPDPLAVARGKISNHYNGVQKKLEWWVDFEKKEDKGKRPTAPNVVPRFWSAKWPISEEHTLYLWPEEAAYSNETGGLAVRNSRWRVWLYYAMTNLPEVFWEPMSVQTNAQYVALRDHHPNVLWSQLQLFGHYLFDKELAKPEVYVSTVAQRLRSLNALERGNTQSQQLQELTFHNLNRYSKLHAPARAQPPDLAKLNVLTVEEQKIFVMWNATGLRRDSFASIRTDLLQLSDDGNFVRAIVPSIKSIPVPGETFAAYIPRAIFYPEVLPVSHGVLDMIARKLGTTSHGIRRGLALYLRRRAAELGLMPSQLDGSRSVAYEQFRQKVNFFFGWTSGSTMWEEIYSEDIVSYVHCDFTVHPATDKWFTGITMTKQ